MPGTQRLRRALRHLAQALGAVPGIALHLLRIAVIGHRPDEEIAGAQHAALRAPHPGVIVGLAAAVMQLEGHAADGDAQPVVIERVGRDRRHAERGIGLFACASTVPPNWRAFSAALWRAVAA